ncbi:MAG TPA: aldehyde dehydrogenase family protein, partial [Anaeromyxobacter sp.]|nr:aldehyde dehydrogenase family protein [Anaeromyxobacter sp.]
MPFLSSVNPTTGEVFAQTEAHPEAEVERRLARAAEVLEAGKERVGRLMTQEMGKTLSSAIAEAEKSARGCRYHAENAERFLADEPVEAGAALSYRRYLPLGPVLAVMPWNFPFWQVFRFAAPAVMAGNVALLQHASSVPLCAQAIEEVLRMAGFPDGVFQALLVGADRVGRLVDDPRVAAVTLTGSEGAGREVA